MPRYSVIGGLALGADLKQQTHLVETDDDGQQITMTIEEAFFYWREASRWQTRYSELAAAIRGVLDGQ